MARFKFPLVKGGGFFGSGAWMPLVHKNGVTTRDGGEEGGGGGGDASPIVGQGQVGYMIVGAGGDASPIVGQGQVGYMVVGQEAASYTVSISLTNPRNAGYFMICEIYELSAPEYEDVFNYVVGNIGQITSATGSTTITSCPRYFLVAPISTEGANVLVPSSGCSTTGGAEYVNPQSGSSWSYAIFEVTGDGTATVDSANYNF